jgi:transposase-like protein
MDLNIECPHCRSGNFIRTANPRRDEAVVCSSCNTPYSYGELEDRATQSARALLATAFPTMALD